MYIVIMGDAPDDDPQAKVKELEERVERLTANWQRSQADPPQPTLRPHNARQEQLYRAESSRWAVDPSSTCSALAAAVLSVTVQRSLTPDSCLASPPAPPRAKPQRIDAAAE